MKEFVYIGRSNKNTIVVRKDGNLIDFSGATRMVCAFTGTNEVADTNVDSSLIDWSEGGGKLIFSLAGMPLQKGAREATLTVYDPDHPDGQVIIDRHGANLTFAFVD